MWLLGRLLPIMIGKKIPEDDDNWSNYLVLLEIVDLLFASEITEDEVCYLSTLILDHHTELCKLYPQASVTPKMHYLIHIPRLIME